MKRKIQKDLKQRRLFNYFEKNKLILKVISKNCLIDEKIRWKIQQKFLNFNKNCSITRIKNRCILTGRAHSVSRFFKLSRHQIRKLASEKKLSGFFKYNW
jgi:small subunit ribosomal protein S14